MYDDVKLNYHVTTKRVVGTACFPDRSNIEGCSRIHMMTVIELE